MALDNSVKLANITMSLKKYFVDSLYTAEGIQLDFGRSYQEVYKALPNRVDQWVIISFEPSFMGALGSLSFNIFMYSRRDPEWQHLFELRDKIWKYLIDTDQTDGLARVELFDVSNPASWSPIGFGAITLSQGRQESGNYIADDGTKFRYITGSLRWGTKG